MEQRFKSISQKRRFWQFPWGYKESFLISFGILISGFIIEYISDGKGISLPGWPINLIFILFFIVYFVFVYKYVKHPIVKWFSSTQAAISSISVLTFLILLMGFIPQENQNVMPFIRKIGLSHVTGSMPYFLCSFYLLVILGFTIVRRFLPFTIKNFAFFLNHAGLWIVVVAASLGSADLWRLNMQLVENKTNFVAYDTQRNPFKMPFALKLLNFSIEEYPPNIALMDNKSGSLKIKKGDKLIDVIKDTITRIENWEIVIDKYIESAIKDSAGYNTSSHVGAVPAVYLIAKNIQTKKIKDGWVTCGSFLMTPEFLMLNDEYSVAMTIPRPKKFSSEIRVFNSIEDFTDIVIEVNKPVKVCGWNIYQSGYNEKMGKWSNMSIVELVRDPWLPVVYTGIFMMLAGAVYLVWMGRWERQKLMRLKL
ncbi:MAG: cytochrome c biogenesis protein ResB [Bacteroidetes bacterium]|nr:cytochrome c biogenesis protein ResB [Bacteroidota bacterium]